MIDPADMGEVLLETQDDVSDAKLQQLEPEEIAAIVEIMPDVDDQADIILALPRHLARNQPVDRVPGGLCDRFL